MSNLVHLIFRRSYALPCKFESGIKVFLWRTVLERIAVISQKFDWAFLKFSKKKLPIVPIFFPLSFKTFRNRSVERGPMMIGTNTAMTQKREIKIREENFLQSRWNWRRKKKYWGKRKLHEYNWSCVCKLLRLFALFLKL